MDPPPELYRTYVRVDRESFRQTLTLLADSSMLSLSAWTFSWVSSSFRPMLASCLSSLLLYGVVVWEETFDLGEESRKINDTESSTQINCKVIWEVS